MGGIDGNRIRQTTVYGSFRKEGRDVKVGLLIESCVNGSGRASQRVDRTRDSR